MGLKKQGSDSNGQDIQKSTSRHSESMNVTGQNQNPSETSPQLTLFDSPKSTFSRSDFLVKTFQLLENERAWLGIEAVYFMRLCGSSGLPRPRYLSLKTSKGCIVPTVDKTLSEYCEKLPTLGFMSVNGNCLILDGYYPKIESGYSLSDILEDEVDQKYFLSGKAILGLIKHKEHHKEMGHGFGATIHYLLSQEDMETGGVMD